MVKIISFIYVAVVQKREEMGRTSFDLSNVKKLPFHS